MEQLISLVMLGILGLFLLGIAFMAVVMVIDLLTGKHPDDMRGEDWGRTSDKDWP